MKHFFVLLAALVCVPTSVGAVFQSEVDLFTALAATNGEPTSMQFSIKGSLDGGSFNMSGNGKMQGTVINNAKGIVEVFLELHEDNKPKETANIWFKLVDETLYVRAESTMPDFLEYFNLKAQTWLAIPLAGNTISDVELLRYMGTSQLVTQKLLATYIPKIFTMYTVPVNDDYEYIVTLKPDYLTVLQELQQEVGGLPLMPTEVTMKDVLTFTMTVRATPANKIIRNTIDVKINHSNVKINTYLVISPLVTPEMLGVVPVGVQVFAPAKGITRAVDSNLYPEPTAATPAPRVSKNQFRKEAVSNTESKLELKEVVNTFNMVPKPNKRSVRAAITK